MKKTNKEQLKLKDFKEAAMCLVLGCAMCTGLFCLFLGFFYNRELNNSLDKIDKRIEKVIKR